MDNSAQTTLSEVRIAFNKENPTDLLMQLVKVFAKAGLKEEASRIRNLSQTLQRSWSEQKKLAAIHEAKRYIGIDPYKKGAAVTSMSDFKAGDLLVVETKVVGVHQQLARVMKIRDDSFDILYVDPLAPSEKRRPSDRPVSIKESQLKAKRQFSKAKKAAEQRAGETMHASKLIDTAIKLAHDHPEFRRPLIARLHRFALGLGVGDTHEDGRSMFRVHHGGESIDVTPAGFKPIRIMGKGVTIEADYNDFRVVANEDPNETTCIPAIKGGKKDIKVFYRWAKDNESKLKNMKFSDIVRTLMSEGVKFHQYCAVD